MLIALFAPSAALYMVSWMRGVEVQNKADWDGHTVDVRTGEGPSSAFTLALGGQRVPNQTRFHGGAGRACKRENGPEDTAEYMHQTTTFI